MQTMKLERQVSRPYWRIAGAIVILMLLWSGTGLTAQQTEWKVFTPENSELPSKEVIALAVSQGLLWIGTRGGGLAKFDRKDWWMVINKDNSELPSNTIPAIAFDLKGKLWVGTDNGLSMFDYLDWLTLTAEKTKLPYNSIHAIAVDAQGALWVGTGKFGDSGGGGLVKFKNWMWDVYTTDNSDLPGNQVLALADDAKGNLWVGTQGNNGVAKFDGETWTVYTSNNSKLPAGAVSAIVCDAQGETWIGTVGGGLARFDGSTWTIYTNQNSGLPNNNVNALAIDSQGVIWIGTEQGLAKFDKTAWSAYTPENSHLPHEWVWALAPDTQGNLWVGTRGGLAAYRQGGVLFPEKSTRGYDRKLVRNAMHTFRKILFSELSDSTLSEAKKNGDFFHIAEQLMELAKTMKSLEMITPRIGSKNDWDSMHGKVIEAAFQGIGACGAEDIEKLKMSVNEIKQLESKGHAGFRK